MSIVFCALESFVCDCRLCELFLHSGYSIESFFKSLEHLHVILRLIYFKSKNSYSCNVNDQIFRLEVKTVFWDMEESFDFGK